MQIIDTHVHFFNKGCKESFKKVMKKYGISKAIILEWPKGLKRKKFLSFDELYPAIKKEKNLFLAVSLRVEGNKRLEEDIKKVKERLKLRKVVGLKLCPGYDHFFPFDERLEEIYRFCEKKKIPIIFHSGETWLEIKRAPTIFSHPLNFEKLAFHYPKLRMILAHCGYPWFLDAAEICVRNDNVYLDISDILPQEGENFYELNLRFVERSFLELLGIIGSCKKILFATDWCTEEIKVSNYIKFVENLPISKKEKEMIFYKNALKLFKFSLKS